MVNQEGCSGGHTLGCGTKICSVYGDSLEPLLLKAEGAGASEPMRKRQNCGTTLSRSD